MKASTQNYTLAAFSIECLSWVLLLYAEMKCRYAQTVAERNTLQSDKASLSKEVQEQRSRGNALEKRNTTLTKQVIL